MAEALQALAARIQRLESYLSHDAGNQQLQADLADAYVRSQRWGDAKTLLAGMLAQAPLDPQARYLTAVVAQAQGQHDAAVELLAALLAEGREALGIRLALARSAAAQGQWPLVEETLADTDPLRAEPGAATELMLLRVRALHHQSAFEQAMALGRAWAAALGVAMPAAVLGALATLSLDADSVDQAAHWLQLAGQQALNDSAELLGAAGFVEMHQGRLDEAAMCFAESIAKQPAMGRAHLGAGLAHAAMGDTPSAIAALRQAASQMPTHLGTWHALAWLQLLSNDLSGASATFEHALSIDRTFGDSHGGVALIAALRGDAAAAEASIRTGHRLDKSSMNVAMARIVLTQGKGLNDLQVVQQGLTTLLATTKQSGLTAVLRRVAERAVAAPRKQ